MLGLPQITKPSQLFFCGLSRCRRRATTAFRQNFSWKVGEPVTSPDIFAPSSCSSRSRFSQTKLFITLGCRRAELVRKIFMQVGVPIKVAMGVNLEAAPGILSRVFNKPGPQRISLDAHSLGKIAFQRLHDNAYGSPIMRRPVSWIQTNRNK